MQGWDKNIFRARENVWEWCSHYDRELVAPEIWHPIWVLAMEPVWAQIEEQVREKIYD